MKKFVAWIMLSVLLVPVVFADAHAQTYRLTRASVVYSDGTIFDSQQSGVNITGTMTITGSKMIQELTVCSPGCASVTVTGTILSIGENAHSVTVLNPNGMLGEIVILSFYPLMTFTNVGSYAEVDQWVPISTFLSDKGGQEQNNIEAATGIPGGIVGAAAGLIGQ